LFTATNHYHAVTIRTKRTYNSSLISSSPANPRQLKKISISFFVALLWLLYPLLTLTLLFQLCAKFHNSLLINRISASPHFPPPFTPPNFSSFTCVTTDEVSKLLTITVCMSTGIFLCQFKNCSVHPHLKKSNLDKDALLLYLVSIVLYLTSDFYHNLLKELLNYVLLTIYLPTNSSILSSLNISNIILLTNSN